MIVTLILNSVALAALLIMLASGLALIYGLRDVMNFGHGAIYMLGAYLGYSVSDAMNFWVALVVFRRSWPVSASPSNFGCCGRCAGVRISRSRWSRSASA